MKIKSRQTLMLLSILIILILSFIVQHFVLTIPPAVEFGKIVSENIAIQIKSPTDGIISQLLVKNAQRVKAGQTLAVINTDQIDKTIKGNSAPLPSGNQRSGINVNIVPVNLPTLSLPPLQINGQVKIKLKPKKNKEINKQKNNDTSIKSDEALKNYQELYNNGVLSKNEFETFKKSYMKSKKTGNDNSNQSTPANQDKILPVNNYPAQKSTRNADVVSRKAITTNITAPKISNQISVPTIVYKKKKIIAPIDGIIKMQADYKQWDPVKRGEIILSLNAINTRLYADIKIPAKKINTIQLQQKISFKVQNKSEKFFGTIQSIKFSDSKTKNNIPDYIIRVKPEKDSFKEANGKIYKLESGMPVTTEFLNK